MSNNTYTFTTKLKGFIRLDAPGGKFNNCGFEFTIPEDVLDEMVSDREPLVDWAKRKAGPKALAALPKWEEDGSCKYTFDGDSNNPRFPIIDSVGNVIPPETLKGVFPDTVVQLLVQQKPYTKPNYGTTLKVLGMQVIKLVNGFSEDQGTLEADEVFKLLGQKEGFKASDPQPQAREGFDEEEDADVPF